MKKALISLLAMMAVVFFSGLMTKEGHAATIYRNYNLLTGEHLYSSYNEWNTLPTKSAYWQQDTVTFSAPSKGASVYRLYNSRSGEHLYTTGLNEKNTLARRGWTYEGVAFHSGGKVKVYRLYNPKAGIGAHLNTASSLEKNTLVKRGWKYEGIAWYANASGTTPANITVTLKYNPNYRPNSDAISKWMVYYMNQLRQINGIKAMTHVDSLMLKYAKADVAVMDKKNIMVDHAAGKKPEEKFYNASSYGYRGSDQETAYLQLVNWYNEVGNVDKKTYPYGHRATLLYGGTGIGMAVSNKGYASLELRGTTDWNAWQKINKGAAAKGLQRVTFKYVR
ncbi:CAP domain-containing protein [Lactococcus termiticola]|uniref:Uncharacterized protein n=1 Tax=Lactococcus termiticola TaxID=2169526 RepID=A0A2R5HJI4_9LACT|nr:CAP domain-containing protein [Lactococcus termiticola]GBG96760.1 hypothetical protein NtB2_00884 [Lactococcus termiticola]